MKLFVCLLLWLGGRVLSPSRKMLEADANDAITKIYAKVDTYSAEDRWYFDMPLAIRLHKPLRLRRRWLTNARILMDKSAATTCCNWADDDEPVLSSSPIRKDSYEWFPRADCICSTVCPDESIELVVFQCGSRLKNLSRSL
jgi:hypothetical protein